MQNDNLFLASFFEKVFVKQACNNSYEECAGTHPLFVFETFSDCMTSVFRWEKEETKQNIMDYLTFEIDNKSSVVIGVRPPFNYEPDAETNHGHAYAVMDYDKDQNAVKLYDSCDPLDSGFCASDEKLLPSLTATADAIKGELWVSMDQL